MNVSFDTHDSTWDGALNLWQCITFITRNKLKLDFVPPTNNKNASRARVQRPSTVVDHGWKIGRGKSPKVRIVSIGVIKMCHCFIQRKPRWNNSIETRECSWSKKKKVHPRC